MFVLIFCLEFCWLHVQEMADLLDFKQVGHRSLVQVSVQLLVMGIKGGLPVVKMTGRPSPLKS